MVSLKGAQDPYLYAGLGILALLVLSSLAWLQQSLVARNDSLTPVSVTVSMPNGLYAAEASPETLFSEEPATLLFSAVDAGTSPPAKIQCVINCVKQD